MLVIVADESVDDPIIHAVRAAGWEVWSVSEECPSVDDAVVLEAAADKQAILLTMDSDFGELVFERDQRPPHALIFVRNKGLALGKAIKLVLDALQRNDLSGHYITLTRNTKRRRPLPDWNPS
jgi:predicted nuclease of predicted toxin-antitoxin system